VIRARRLIAITGTLLLLGREALLSPDGRTHLWVLDVGQGDAILVIAPDGSQTLVDSGRGRDVLRSLGRAMPFFDRTIERIVITHTDLDHVGGFPEILRRYRVEAAVLTGVQHDLPAYRALLHLLREKGIPVIVPRAGDRLDLGGVAADVLWPTKDLFGAVVKDTNATSIVLRVGGGSGALLTGDIPASVEKAIAARGSPRAAVLKLAHHGSKTSSSELFLRGVAPRLAIVSAGRRNSYGHPHRIVLDRLVALGIAVQNTALQGDIAVDLPLEP